MSLANKKVISISIDKTLYNRLMKVLQDTDEKLSTILNHTINEHIDQIEKVTAEIKKLKEEAYGKR